MIVLRTPDERFANLSGFPFRAHYLNVPSGNGPELRMAYVDEGKPNDPVVLLLHGEPSWSYLYRKMIATLTTAGYRAIAPDLIGFGRSDKPADPEDYTYQRHVDWLHAFVRQLDLRNVTLFCQDWGGLLGLRMAAEDPERYTYIVAANTFLPTGDMPLGSGFEKWKHYALTTPVFHIGGIVRGGTVKKFSTDLEEARRIEAAYDAPFPDDRYKAGARVFPCLVPATPDDPAAPANRRAWEVLSRWEKPFLTVFGDSDPVTRGADQALQAMIPGAQGQPHTVVKDAGHFIQEDQGEFIAEYVVRWRRGLPS